MMEQMNNMAGVYAQVKGSINGERIYGNVYFHEMYDGTLVVAEINGLPLDEKNMPDGKFYGFHVHEGESCTGDANDPFKNAGGHFNPQNTLHPQHAGDLPPLLSTDKGAWMAVYTDRFHPEDVVGRTVIVHDMPDDFRTQPSGDSGAKIACGEIVERE